jgi:hypothetical protein
MMKTQTLLQMALAQAVLHLILQTPKTITLARLDKAIKWDNSQMIFIKASLLKLQAL